MTTASEPRNVDPTAIHYALEREAATRAILEVISRSRADEKPVFDVILKNALTLCDAPLGAVFLIDEDGAHFRATAHRAVKGDWLDKIRANPPPADPKKSMIAQAAFERKVIQIDDLRDTDLYREGDPSRIAAVDAAGMRTTVAVPILSDDSCLGVICLFRREVRRFQEKEIELVRTFAAQAVIAIENVRQFKALQARTEEVQALNDSLESRVSIQVEELERMGRLKRFLSPQVADAVLSSGDERLLSSHRALIATLFCDMRGFTAFCETAEPEEAIEVLQAYHEEMGMLIATYGAGVDHRSGDGIMVIFNDPLPCDSPAMDAVRLAFAMREKMAGLCGEWRELGHRLGFGVGISLGYATVGLVGSAGRYEYTASGTAVNLAARLCDHAADGEILLSPRAYKAVLDAVEIEPAGQLTLKGFSSPVDVFRFARLKDHTRGVVS